jgi:hypothetical protein
MIATFCQRLVNTTTETRNTQAIVGKPMILFLGFGIRGWRRLDDFITQEIKGTTKEIGSPIPCAKHEILNVTTAVI